MNTQKKATIKKSQNHVNSPKLFFQWFINFYISKSENTIKKKKKIYNNNNNNKNKNKNKN